MCEAFHIKLAWHHSYFINYARHFVLNTPIRIQWLTWSLSRFYHCYFHYCHCLCRCYDYDHYHCCCCSYYYNHYYLPKFTILASMFVWRFVTCQNFQFLQVCSFDGLSVCLSVCLSVIFTILVAPFKQWTPNLAHICILDLARAL